KICLESYRGRFPILFERSELLHDVAFEEYSQLAQAGMEIEPSSYRERYGLDVSIWPAASEFTPKPQPTALLDKPHDSKADSISYQDLISPATFVLRRIARARYKMPQAGQQFLDFDILRELGRGAFSRVYLGRQRHLADRLVVLKVSAQLDEEP